MPDPAPERPTGAGSLLTRIGTDWWATILGLAATALAVAGALPKVPW